MDTTRTDVGTVEDLHASATRMTGLDDFGDDDHLDGLRVLLDSYAHESALTPLGSKMKRSFLRGALTARLLSEAAWRQYPEHADVPVTRPIFVTGLPRTGTTVIHRLLTADPRHQGLELWLAEFPQPRPDPAQLQTAVADASAAASTARTLGVVAIVAGVLGLILGALALARSRQSEPEVAPRPSEPSGKLIR